MGIYEDVEDLKGQIRRAIDTQDKQSIGALLKEAFALCENIKKTIETSDDKERKKLSETMQGFRGFLENENKKLSKKMGLSEEQFTRFSENPENFSKEQWRGMQLIKHKFAEKTKELRQTIRHHAPSKKGGRVEKGALPENWRQLIAENPNIVSISPAIPPPLKKKKQVIRKIKKDKWIKS